MHKFFNTVAMVAAVIGGLVMLAAILMPGTKLLGSPALEGMGSVQAWFLASIAFAVAGKKL